MIIIIEGPDNVGKGTQIKNILNRFSEKDECFHILHYMGLKNSDINFYKKTFNEMFRITETKDINFLLDRSHLGDYVYGDIYRHYDPKYIFDIEFDNMIDKRDDIFLITFIDKPENLIKREDGESFTTEPSIKQLEIDRFKEAHNKSYILNKMLLNIDNLNEDEVKEIIFEFLDI